MALNVSTDLVEVFRRLLLRVEGTVYVGPRMGTGEYRAKTEVA